MNEFRDHVVLITGAGSGIGRALAVKLAAEGARIAAIDVNAASLKSLETELAGKSIASAPADVTKIADLRAAVQSLESQLGPTDVLIACAGLGRATPAVEHNADAFASIINVNLIGVSNSVDAVLAGMRERKSGHLVVLSSLASYRGLPHMSAYCASKTGVSALFDSLRVELRPFNIATTTICPGFIRTPMVESLPLPTVQIMELDYAIERILWAIRRRRPHYAFPFRSAWQVRMLKYLPRSWSDWLMYRVFQKMTQK